MDHIILNGADFCFLPGNDCDRTKMTSVLSVNDLRKTAHHFKRRNIRIRKPIDALKGKPFRSNNNIPMGHRIY